MKTKRVLRILRRKTLRGGKQSDFPEKKGVKYSKLMMTPEGEYSITKRKDGEVLLKHMKSVIGNLKDKHITDLTGNVGGDTILFGIHFKKVDSVELNPENFAALKNNVEVFDLPNVTLHHGDSTKLFNWKTDVLYADPPWGGTDYKSKEKLDLYLGETRIDEFIHEVLQRENRPDYVFLKVPRNYNFDRFPQAKKFRIRGFYILALK